MKFNDFIGLIVTNLTLLLIVLLINDKAITVSFCMSIPTFNKEILASEVS